MTNNRPLHTIRYGAIRVSIWANATPLGDFYNVTASRCYKKDDQWHDSSSIGELDIPTLIMALHDAHAWIQTRKNADQPPLALPPPPSRMEDDSGYDD